MDTQTDALLTAIFGDPIWAVLVVERDVTTLEFVLQHVAAQLIDADLVERTLVRNQLQYLLSKLGFSDAAERASATTGLPLSSGWDTATHQGDVCFRFSTMSKSRRFVRQTN
jgi:hypothetical protein